MAIAKMTKLCLVGFLDEKDDILDEISKIGKCDIKECSKLDGAKNFENSEEITNLNKIADKTERVLTALEEICSNKEKKECSYQEFLSQKEKFDSELSVVDEAIRCLDEIVRNHGLIKKYKKEKNQMIPNEIKKFLTYSQKKEVKFSKNEEKLKSILSKINKLLPKEENDERIENYNFIKNEDLRLEFELNKDSFESVKDELLKINGVELKKESDKIVEIYFSFKYLGPEMQKVYESKIRELDLLIEEYEKKNADLYNTLKGFSKNLNDLKIFCDYVFYQLEKLNKESLMQKTDKTFSFMCYIEEKEEQAFTERLSKKFENLLIEKQKIKKSDNPPTKIVGSKITKQAEFVVNMYSVPNYRDVDPTWSVFLFFMVFFGFIVADVGYGIVLCVLGFCLANKKGLSTGAKKLWKLIGTAGIFTIVWGALFGSVFGFNHELLSFIPQGVMPDPQNDAITLLLICLLMGIIQIAFGYLLRGINYFKHKQIMPGLVNGVAWVLFLIGLVMGAAKFLVDFFKIQTSSALYGFLSAIQTPGLVIMLVGLGFGVVLAGIGSKGFTKFTKSFSALYGIINLFSDILSYARLFGLMLSGAIIGQQFNEIGLSVMTSPLGYVFGFLIMLIGHSFNIAMGALGAYIHDTRLQYVEYFGKFYNGEGELYKPFCVEQKHIKILDFEEERK